MATDIERLVVSLEANQRKFEKELQKAVGTANKQTKAIEGRFSKMNANITGMFASFGKGFLGGTGGVAGITAALRSAASGIAEIRNEAARAGVTTRVFQEWQAVAVKARVPMDALTDAFKELNIRGDEFAQTAKGSAAEAFARLGLTPAEVKERLKDPAEFMILLIERTRQLKDTAAATRIFDELFGGTGAERLVALLGQSTDEIRATIREANDLGNVLDEDVIVRAAEIDRQFNQISHTVGQNLKGAIVEAATALNDFINAFRGFEFERTTKLGERMAALGKDRLDVERQIVDLQGKQRAGEAWAGDGILGSSFGESTVLEALADARRQMEAIAAEEQMIQKVLDSRKQEAPPAATGSGWTPTPYTPPAGSGGKGTRDKAARDAEREAEAVRRLIGELEHELALVGATDLERETANMLRQAGAAATDEQRAKIVALVAALHAEEEASRRASDAAQELRDIGRDVLGGMVSDLREGKKAADILANALDRVADRLINMALDGLFSGLGKGGGNLIGSTFSLNLRRTA